MQIGNLLKPRDSGFDNPQEGRIYSVRGIAPTINTSGGGQREPLILICEEKK